MEKAVALLSAAESECTNLSTKKTKVVAFNTTATLTARDGSAIEVADDFKYLDSYLSSIERDLKVRKALLWSALHTMNREWRYDLDDNLKRQPLWVTVESVSTDLRGRSMGTHCAAGKLPRRSLHQDTTDCSKRKLGRLHSQRWSLWRVTTYWHKFSGKKNGVGRSLSSPLRSSNKRINTLGTNAMTKK